jgi:hypothetical protein
MNLNSLLIALGLLFAIHTRAQKIIINGQEGNRKLTWDDFTGKPDKSDPFMAYTHWNISQKMDNIRVMGDSVTIGSMEVTLELDPKKSWAKKGNLSDELLVHEQGHFDLGLMCQREILTLLKQAKFTKTNLSYTVQNIINSQLVKYDGLMKKYDQETNHSANKEQQKKWNLLFAEALK